MTQISRRTFVASGTVFLLSACSVARDAPRKGEVLSGGDMGDGDAEALFSVVEVTSDTLKQFAGWPVTDSRPAQRWPSRGGGLTSQRLTAGDSVSLRVWTAEETSLLTSPGQRFADIPNLKVSQSGHINLPYVGEVHVAGLRIDSARARVEDSLSGIIPSAQVQLDADIGRRNSVDMLGGVGAPGTFPMEERNLTVLNLVSQAGGPKDTLVNPQVLITRGNTVYRMPYEDVLENPERDVALAGGDRVVLVDDDREFTALGATGTQKTIGFDTEDLSALHAVSLIGGIADNRADPRGLLVLRRYAKADVGRPGGPPKEKVVFSLDLTKADTLFAADQFMLQDGDVVLATQAGSTTAQRIMGLFGAILGAGRTISNID
jgi:polysaccharide export outer membrane protein